MNPSDRSYSINSGDRTILVYFFDFLFHPIDLFSMVTMVYIIYYIIFNIKSINKNVTDM